MNARDADVQTRSGCDGGKGRGVRDAETPNPAQSNDFTPPKRLDESSPAPRPLSQAGMSEPPVNIIQGKNLAPAHAPFKQRSLAVPGRAVSKRLKQKLLFDKKHTSSTSLPRNLT